MLPLIHFTVTNCQDQGTHPETGERYWTADVRAERPGVLERTFLRVVFAEDRGKMVFVLGMENEHGVSANLPPERQNHQRDFVTFLHNQTAFDRHPMSELFTGSEYRVEAKVMVAYLSARGLTHAFGFGYFDRNGEYQLLRIERAEGL